MRARSAPKASVTFAEPLPDPLPRVLRYIYCSVAFKASQRSSRNDFDFSRHVVESRCFLRRASNQRRADAGQRKGRRVAASKAYKGRIQIPTAKISESISYIAQYELHAPKDSVPTPEPPSTSSEQHPARKMVQVDAEGPNYWTKGDPVRQRELLMATWDAKFGQLGHNIIARRSQQRSSSAPVQDRPHRPVAW